MAPSKGISPGPHNVKTVSSLSQVAAASICLTLIGATCLPQELAPRPRSAKVGTQPGGSIRVGIQEPLSVDPVLAADPSGSMITRTICDPLIQADPVTGELKPAIAKSWLLTEDGKKITVVLNQGIKFHDGADVTAQDAVFALTRLVQPATASPFAQLLRPVEGFEEATGENQDSGGAAAEPTLESGTLRGLVAQEKFSFEISLSTPNADFLRILTSPFSSPVPMKKGNKESFSNNPVCTGPYQLASPWKPGTSSIKARRFNDYHRKSVGFTGGGHGYADQIEFRVLPDAAAEFAEFQAGRLDVAHVPRDKMEEARARGSDLVQGPNPNFEYIGLPPRAPPFNNVLVRRALSRGIDRTALAQSAFQGSRQPARGFFPPSLGRIHRSAACGLDAPLRADVVGAKDLLARAKEDLNGKTAKFYYNDEFGNKALIEEVARQWDAAFGFKVQPTSMVWDQYLALGVGPFGYDGPFRMTWRAEYSSAERFLAPLFEGVNIPASNLTRFNDHFFNAGLEIARQDKLLDIKTKQIRAAEDERDRRVKYQFLEDRLCTQMPAIPVDFGLTSLLVNRDRIDSAVSAFTDRTSGEPLLRELFVRHP